MNIEYISGFFDADGSITMCKNNRDNIFRSIKIDFTNTEKDILIKIKKYLNSIDITCTITTKSISKENHNISFTLSIQGNQNCIKFCKLVSSKHPKKLHRINTVLKYHDKVTKRNGKYNEKEFTKRIAYERLFFCSIFQLRSDYIIIPYKREQDAKSGH